MLQINGRDRARMQRPRAFLTTAINALGRNRLLHATRAAGDKNYEGWHAAGSAAGSMRHAGDARLPSSINAGAADWGSLWNRFMRNAGAAIFPGRSGPQGTTRPATPAGRPMLPVLMPHRR
jgi:hypothetical protein